jgi:hypothetical protein
MKKTILGGIAAAAAAASLMLASPAQAHADGCNGPGLPPCAPPMDSATQCALIAWRTWTPCNWYGVQVPVGTPGSWG